MVQSDIFFVCKEMISQRADKSRGLSEHHTLDFTELAIFT